MDTGFFGVPAPLYQGAQPLGVVIVGLALDRQNAQAVF